MNCGATTGYVYRVEVTETSVFGRSAEVVRYDAGHQLTVSMDADLRWIGADELTVKLDPRVRTIARSLEAAPDRVQCQILPTTATP